MIRMQTPLAPRLRLLPELDHYEIHVGSLNDTHVGRTVAVNTGVAVVAGQLESITESAVCGKARLVLRISGGATIGSLALGLHPSHPVIVLPRDHKLTVTVTPNT
jgi:hypothetical protein